MIGNAAEFLSSRAGQPKSDSSAERPAGAMTCKVGCWNIGWDYNSKKHSSAQLAHELWRVWEQHGFDAFGLSQVLEVDYTNPQELQKVTERRQTILDELLEKFNEGVSQSCASAPWLGQMDAHCMFIYRRTLNLISSDSISLRVANQVFRKAQYFCFHLQLRIPCCMCIICMRHHQAQARSQQVKGAKPNRIEG